MTHTDNTGTDSPAQDHTKSIAILVSAGEAGQDFVDFLNSRGLTTVPAPADHPYAGVKGPYVLYLVRGTRDEVEVAVLDHGVGGKFRPARTPDPESHPEVPAAWVVFA
jgi:hypothetical protein